MVLEEVLQHLSYQEKEILEIEYFLDIRRRDRAVEIHVQWRGFK